MEKPRLQHFDVLKGFAIFLVVTGHVLTFCIRDIDRAILFKFIELVHMPMFFFISGYFSYKEGFAMPRLLNRFRQLVIPGAVMLWLWSLYFPHTGLQSPLDTSWDGVMLNEYKNGYWFPFVLFAIILIYSLLAPILRRIGNDVAQVLLTAVFCFGATVAVSRLASPYISGLLSLRLITQFLVPFMFGIFCHRNQQMFNAITTRPGWYTAALLVAGLSIFFLAYRWDYPRTEPLQPWLMPLFHLALPVAAITVARQWCAVSFTADHTTRAAKIWNLLGRESLAIYLLHYFFLFPLPGLQEPLRNAALDLVPTLIVALPVAAAIIAVTLAVNYLISFSPLLSQLLTGQLKPVKYTK